MFKLIQALLGLTAVLMAKAKADTSFDQALALNEAGQYKEAFPLMKEAAEAGNVRAMSSWAGCTCLGEISRKTEKKRSAGLNRLWTAALLMRRQSSVWPMQRAKLV